MATRHRIFADVEASGWKRTRRVTTGDMDITPMIDVVFLLLIFFMVASTMQGTPEIDVPPAVHSLGVEANDAVVVTIFAASARVRSGSCWEMERGTKGAWKTSNATWPTPPAPAGPTSCSKPKVTSRTESSIRSRAPSAKLKESNCTSASETSHPVDRF